MFKFLRASTAWTGKPRYEKKTGLRRADSSNNREQIHLIRYDHPLAIHEAAEESKFTDQAASVLSDKTFLQI